MEVYVLTYKNEDNKYYKICGVIEDNGNFHKNLYDMFKDNAEDLIVGIDEAFEQLLEKEYIYDDNYEGEFELLYQTVWR